MWAARSSSTASHGIVFAVLMVLLVVTYEAARHDLGRWNMPTAMLIASLKAVLVAWFFMKLRRAVTLTQLAAVAGLLWLAIMFALTLSDYRMR